MEDKMKEGDEDKMEEVVEEIRRTAS